jgi:AcrR family transcriptional regulator
MTGEEPLRRGRGRPRDPEADAAILRAALDLFIEGGVEGTSIEQIAKRAGVGKLTVYRRWSSKEELLAQAIESARDRVQDATSVEDPAEVSMTELIERALPAAAEALADDRFRTLVARIFGSSKSHPALMATYWEHYIVPRRHATRVLLEQAKKEGVLAEDTDMDVLIDMMVGGVLYRAIQPGPLDVAEARRYLEAVYRQAGLLPPAPR